MNILLYKEIKDDILCDSPYRIYCDDGKCECGEMYRMENGYYWKLNIPMAEISIKGRYRNDVMEEAELKFKEFYKKRKGE